MGSLGSENPLLDVVLGYDPWEFPRLVDPKRDLAYFVFGWCIYETALCTSILIQARKKWRSSIFQALTLALLMDMLAAVLGIVTFSNSPEGSADLLFGPTEFAFGLIFVTAMLVARWCYFYTMTAITLSVFREKYKKYRVIVCLVTALAMASSLSFTIAICNFFRLQYEQYVIYMETRNIGAVLSRIPNAIIPSLPLVVISQNSMGITMILFVLFTKIPFLLKIFSALNVPFRQAIKTMATTKSTQRIVSSTLWTIAEVYLMSTIGTKHVTAAIALFSMTFQTTAMAMLAFEGSATIIREHSLASRPGSTVKRSTVTSAHGGGSRF